MAQQIEELYETRNRCVHAGLIDVEKDEISAAIQLIGKTIAALVDRAPFCSMKSLNDVLRELDPALDIPRREWIAINAYYRWLGQGCPLGTDVQNWLDAEKEYMNTSI